MFTKKTGWITTCLECFGWLIVHRNRKMAGRKKRRGQIPAVSTFAKMKGKLVTQNKQNCGNAIVGGPTLQLIPHFYFQKRFEVTKICGNWCIDRLEWKSQEKRCSEIGLEVKKMKTLPETNTAPQNGWLEYYFPFGIVYFYVRAVSFGYFPSEQCSLSLFGLGWTLFYLCDARWGPYDRYKMDV